MTHEEVSADGGCSVNVDTPSGETECNEREKKCGLPLNGSLSYLEQQFDARSGIE